MLLVERSQSLTCSVFSVCVDLLVPSSTCGEHKERDMRVLIMTEVVQVAQLLPVQ